MEFIDSCLAAIDSWLVGIVGALISVIVGTLWGATAGYIGGRVDNIMMRFVDVLMAIPYMFVLILLLVVFGRSIIMLFVGIGLISWRCGSSTKHSSTDISHGVTRTILWATLFVLFVHFVFSLLEFTATV